MKFKIEEKAKIIQIGTTLYLRISPTASNVTGFEKGTETKQVSTNGKIVITKAEV